ncbi:transposase [Streptomyces chartreusis]|uniref:transposase n=1 Tax=Streptomyces chartreusis TaxID=1969 RepID=UPI0033D3E2CC
MTGRPRASDRQVVNGMVYKIRTGISRRDLPERYGPWQTVDTRFRRYALDGLFTRALHTSKLVRTRPATSTGPSRSTPPSSAPTSTPPPTEKGAPSAGRTRRSRPRHPAYDGKGRPLAVLVTTGQRHDSICARPLLERIRALSRLHAWEFVPGALGPSRPSTWSSGCW